jgi:hypothetical protein
MPVNGHASSSQTVFVPTQDGHRLVNRISVTADASPSAVRPDGLPAARELIQSGSSHSDVSSVDGERPALRGWQDKGALGSAPQAVPQPAPGTERARRSVSDTGSARSQNSIDWLKRSARLTLRVRPGVKTALERLAAEDEISLSKTAATGLEIFARAKIHEQEETLFEPRMRSMLRREIRSSDNRHVPFEIENAIASEQTRILFTDLYKRQLTKEGVPLKEINKKLDQAYHMARANVLNTRTTRRKNQVAQYWEAIDAQESNRQDHQVDSREAGTTNTGEAGEGNTHA